MGLAYLQAGSRCLTTNTFAANGACLAAYGMGARAAELFSTLDHAGRDDVDLACGLTEVDLDRSHSIAGVEIAPNPAVGSALVAGAHENVTPVIWRIPPFRPGMPQPRPSARPHGGKWILGGSRLQPRILPREGFPRILPVQSLRTAQADQAYAQLTPEHLQCVASRFCLRLDSRRP